MWYFIIWYLVGLLGSGFIWYKFNGEMSNKDIVMCMISGLFGPIAVLVHFLCYISTTDDDFWNKKRF